MSLRFSRAAFIVLMAVFFTLPGVSNAYDLNGYTPPPMFEGAVSHAIPPVPAPAAIVGGARQMPYHSQNQNPRLVFMGAPYAAALQPVPPPEASAKMPSPPPASSARYHAAVEHPPVPGRRPSRFRVSPDYAKMLREGKIPVMRQAASEPVSAGAYRDGDILSVKPMSAQDVLESLE